MSDPQNNRWVLTWNNYTEEDVKILEQWLESKAAKSIVEKEVGKEGTPHLQGYVEFPSRIRFSTISRAFGKAHWEIARKPRQNNIDYCSKDGTVLWNTLPKSLKERVMSLYDGVVWFPWQQDIISYAEGPVHQRKIYWFYERQGNTGKSFLTKYLYLKYNAIICTGKSTDIFNQVKVWMDTNEDQSPSLVVCDIPRVNQDYVSYQSLECLKNGLIYSGKYEGGVCCFEMPHVICLSNAPPDLNKMSMDRWAIYRISNGNAIYEMDNYSIV